MLRGYSPPFLDVGRDADAAGTSGFCSVEAMLLMVRRESALYRSERDL